MNDIEPGQTYEVNFFRPEDAEGVTRLFKTVYGDSYPIKTFIDPKLLIEENAAGRTISSVARTPKGDIIGHNALFRSAPYDRIYESGSGAVHPHYRGGKGIFTRLIAHGFDVGPKRFGIEAIYGESVCNHIFTQKTMARLSTIEHAIEIGLMPAEAYEKEKSATGRVAAILGFRTLKPKPHAVHLPAVYEKSMQFIYSALDDDRDFVLSRNNLPSSIKTEIKTQVFDFAQVARLAVHDAGTDFESALEREERSLLEKGLKVLQVWLELSWPWIGQAVDALRRRGYFLGGILPRWFDVDGMLMQKIIGDPNWEGIQLYSNRAKKILDMIKKDWQRSV
jgi:hypothetical protein